MRCQTVNTAASAADDAVVCAINQDSTLRFRSDSRADGCGPITASVRMVVVVYVREVLVFMAEHEVAEADCF